ncbi:MAG: hypothetical protein ABUS57_00470 [Pseudomonadota bacterium]
MSSPADLMLLAHRLRDASRDNVSIEAAQVRVIGLDEIRQALGPRWPRIRERVREGSLHILSKFVDADDVIMPAGDGFLVIFGELKPGISNERCLKMREALLSFYLGEEALQNLLPEVTARSLSADGLADLMSSQSAAEDEPNVAGPAIVKARVFSVRETSVVAHWYCPLHRDQTGRRLAYDPDYMFDAQHHVRDFVDLDMAILAAAKADDMRGAAAIGFTVHASTMQNRKRRDLYLDRLAKLPESWRSRAIITIAEIEKGAPLMSIAEWCLSVRALMRRVCLDFHYTDHALQSVGSAGAWAVGYHLPIYRGAQSGPRATRTLEQIRFWSQALHAQGLRLAVNGFREGEFLRAARQAGVDLATSDTLWPFENIEPANAASAKASMG